MLGKPEASPALVLNTVLRKPGGQLPLAGVRGLEMIEVPERLEVWFSPPVDEDEIGLLEFNAHGD